MQTALNEKKKKTPKNQKTKKSHPKLCDCLLGPVHTNQFREC